MGGSSGGGGGPGGGKDRGREGKTSSSSSSSSSSRRKRSDSKSSRFSFSRDRDRGLSSDGRDRGLESFAPPQQPPPPPPPLPSSSSAPGKGLYRDADRDLDLDWDEVPRSLDRDRSSSRNPDRRGERSRAHPGDMSLPPLDTSGAAAASGSAAPAPAGGPSTSDQFAADIAAPGFSQFPMQNDDDTIYNNNPNNPNSTNSAPSFPPATSAAATSGHDSPAAVAFDSHVPQQFPGQFPDVSTEPYRPTNPAGEAADYYGDQGESVQNQPGVRPDPPSVIPNSHAHLMPASPAANPPPEPSSVGAVGAAADYYGDTPTEETHPAPETQPTPENPNQVSQEPAAPASKPPRPSKPSKPNKPSRPPGVTNGVGIGPSASSSPESHQPPTPHSHGVGPAVGVAAAGAAAGYMMNHHSHHSSSSEHHAESSSYGGPNQETFPPHDLYQESPSLYPNPALNHPSGAAHPSHPDHQAIYHPSPFQSGGLAFQQRQRGPVDKFMDFWRDPEGVGEFEEYTETIGICKYCFEPGTSSRDAPRKHNYRPRRRSSDRYSNGSRVDKAARYSSSSDDESRRSVKRSSKKSSWLGGLFAGAAVKSLFNSKDFEDSYSVHPSPTGSPRSTSFDSERDPFDTKSRGSSRGRRRRSSGSQSPGYIERAPYSELKGSGRPEARRSRSRSDSSSRSGHHSAVRDIALGAAVGTAVSGVAGRSKNRGSPKRTRTIDPKDPFSASSSSSYMDISKQSPPSTSGVKSFFTSSSENRQKAKPRKRRKSIFSFNNSSSSSLDNDLAFGNAFTKKPGKSKGKGKKGKKDRDIDAELVGLSAAATTLANSSDDHDRRPGAILAGKSSRSRRSDHSAPGTTDEDWEDLGSDKSASSMSSALAFGDSSPYGASEDSSDSGTSKWSWRWGSSKKTDKKKNEKDSGFPTGPMAAGAAALGTAAIASKYQHEKQKGRDSGSSSESLQRVMPMPTSDPSHFEAAAAQPALIRPGPIPLQQPQPVTPVSQAVYSSQGESIPAYSAASDPLLYGPRYPPAQDRSVAGPWSQSYDVFPERSDAAPNADRSSRERDWSPARASAISGSKPRSTPRDQGSVVQFKLTDEQKDRENRADRRVKRKRDSRDNRDQGIQLVDHERDDEAERRERRRREREEERRPSTSRERSRRDTDREDDGSLIGPAVAGAIGAAATSSILSNRSSNDDSSEASERRQERSEKRRAQRRKQDWGSESQASPSVIEDKPREEVQQSAPEPRAPREKPVYDNYAAFFAPDNVNKNPAPASGPETRELPRESQPASQPIIHQDPPYQPALRTYARAEPSSPGYGGLPWPVPQLNLIEPTPPASQNGSVRDITSPIPPYQEPPQEPTSEEIEVVPQEPPREGVSRDQPMEPLREVPEEPYEEAPPRELSRELPEKTRELPSPARSTGSRVSWGPHQMHEYEVPSEHESVDDEVPREFPARVADKQPSVEDDIEFAATLAAGTAAAGFDPKVVTDDPSYHMRSPPMGSANWPPVSDYSSAWQEQEQTSVEPYEHTRGEVNVPDETPFQRRLPTEKALPLRVKNLGRDSPEVVQSPSIPRELPQQRGQRDLSQQIPTIATSKEPPAPVPAQDEPVPMPGSFDAEPESQPVAREAPTARSVLSKIPVKGEKRRSSRGSGLSRAIDEFEPVSPAVPVSEDRDGKDGSDKENQVVEPRYQKV